MTSYNYTLGVDFTATNIDLSAFQNTISSSSISSATVQYLTRSGNVVTIFFSGALSGPDQTTLNGLVSAYVFVAPTTLVYVDTTTQQDITNKNLYADSIYFTDPTTVSKRIGFQASGASASTTMTIASVLATSRTYTVPDTGASSSFLMTDSTGTQSIASGNLSLTGASATLALTGATSTLTLANTAASTTSSTGALQCAGGAYFGANSLYNANITMQGASAILALSGASSVLTLANTAASTSSVTGALRCAGGAYFGANSLYNANITMQGASAVLALTGASSIIDITNTNISTSTTTGAIQNAGGMAVKNIWLAGVSFANQAVSLNGPIFNTPATTITATNTADMAFLSIQQPTLANSVAASTTANASTLYIAGAPAAGTNQTITNAYALNVAAGTVRIGGTLQIPTGASNGFYLQSDASGNASWASVSTSFTGFSDGTVSAPGAYWISQTSTGFYRPASGQIFITLAGTNTAGFTSTSTFSSVTLTLTGTGSTTISAGTLYSNPGSTAFSGANNYFFNYFNTPTTTGTTTGTASTVFIAGAPANATTAYALNVAAGNTLFGGDVLLNAASAVLSLSGATSALTLANTAASTSSVTGALRCAGGAFFGANSLINANLTLGAAASVLALTGATSTLTLANTAASTTSTTGALQCAGGAYFGANSLYNANITMQGAAAVLALSGATSAITLANTAVSTSTTTGALRSAGGIAVRNIWLAGVSFANQAVSLNGPIFNTPATTITATNTADMAFMSIQQLTLANSVAASTTANASTLYIAGAPAAGTNQTITNAYALNVDAGTVRIGGTLQIPTGAAAGYMLASDASGNASWVLSSSSTNLAYFNANSTTIFSTNATAATNISSMTLTPTTAGTYFVQFTANFRIQSSNRTATFDLAFNGTSITNTTNAFTQNNQQNSYSVTVTCIQSFNGTTDTVTARTFSSIASSSVTVNFRSIYALRMTS